MTEQEQPPQEDDYWNMDADIGEVTIWRDQRYTLRLKAHVAEEIYRQGKNEEIIPLSQQRGVRIYVQAKPYVLLPDITMTVGLYPTPEPTGAVGEVTASDWQGMRHEEIGHCQAWYYVADRTIVLWEAYMLDRFRKENLLEDPNSYALWQGFEGFLQQRFPSARLIATTHDDPLYDREQYQEFLTSMGYRQINERAWGKDLGQEEAT